jgi:hypothetical protein
MHAEWDRLANGDVQSGELPPWTHVTGPVLWYVAQGPYAGIGEAWTLFMKKAHARFPAVELSGPPGDVYVCDPADHAGAGASRLTTLMWAPVRPWQ